MLNFSFSAGIVPAALKMPKVIPVHKKAEKHLVSDCRPISLLSVFDKILEKLMYFRLYNYLTATGTVETRLLY